jgi:hypothetical protein
MSPDNDHSEPVRARKTGLAAIMARKHPVGGPVRSAVLHGLQSSTLVEADSGEVALALELAAAVDGCSGKGDFRGVAIVGKILADVLETLRPSSPGVPDERDEFDVLLERLGASVRNGEEPGAQDAGP